MVCGVLWPLWQFLLKHAANQLEVIQPSGFPVASKHFIISSPEPALANAVDTQAAHTDEFRPNLLYPYTLRTKSPEFTYSE